LKRYHLQKCGVLFVFMLGVGGILFFTNAGNYYLWGDEGETALYGKEILKHGLPYGFDGRNLFEFRNGYSLNRDFLPTISPWLQFYIAAMSMKIFGCSSFGARALFILLSLVALITQFLFVSHYFKNQRLAYISLALLVTSVSFILFSRQSRYYALVMFLTPTLCYLYCLFKERKCEYFIVSFIFILLFLANALIAVAFCVSSSISFFFFDNRLKTIKFFMIPLLIAVPFLGGFLLCLYQKGGITDPNFLRNIHPADFLKIIWLYFKDYNIAQLLPFGIIFALAFVWYREGVFKGGEPFLKARRELSILSIVILFTIILSILSPQVSMADNSDIRYATAIFPFLLLLQAFVVEKVYIQRRLAAYVLLTVLVGTNLLTFTPFRSYIFEYVRENVSPFDNSVKTAVRFLNNRIRSNDIVLVTPNHMLGSMEFYLGDNVLFCNVIGEDNKNLLASGVKLPKYIYSTDTIPDWIVLFGLGVDMPHTAKHLSKLNLSNYKIYAFPIMGPDVSRPELFWRSFAPITHFPPEQGLFILERVKGKTS